MDNHLLPVIGDAYLDTLTRSDVQRAFNIISGKPRLDLDGKPMRDADGALVYYAPNTLAAFFNVFRKMIHDAENDGKIERDPCKRISLRGVGTRKQREHAAVVARTKRTPEVDNLIDILEDFEKNEPRKLFMLLSLKSESGLRFVHASVVKWDDFEFSPDPKKCGWLYPKRARDGGEIAEIAENKPVPEHGVPISPSLQAKLLAYRRECFLEQSPGFAKGWVFPQSQNRAPGKKQNRGDGPITQDEWQRGWRRARERLRKAAIYEIPRGVGPHAMRRSVVNIMGKNGVDPQTATGITGHQTFEQLMNYRDLRPKHIEAATMVISNTIEMARARHARANEAKGARAAAPTGTTGSLGEPNGALAVPPKKSVT